MLESYLQEASWSLLGASLKEESPGCTKQGTEGNLRRETASVPVVKIIGNKQRIDVV